MKWWCLPYHADTSTYHRPQHPPLLKSTYIQIHVCIYYSISLYISFFLPPPPPPQPDNSTAQYVLRMMISQHKFYVSELEDTPGLSWMRDGSASFFAVLALNCKCIKIPAIYVVVWQVSIVTQPCQLPSGNLIFEPSQIIPKCSATANKQFYATYTYSMSIINVLTHHCSASARSRSAHDLRSTSKKYVNHLFFFFFFFFFLPL